MPPSRQDITPRTIAILCDPDLRGDVLFDPTGSRNRDGGLDCWVAARPALQARGWEVHTDDIFRRRGQIPEITFLGGIPRGSLGRQLGPWHGKTSPMVFLWEAFLIWPQNWNMRKHQDYNALFTWDPRLIDDQHYFRISAVPRKFMPDFTIDRDLAKKTGFLTAIAGHKKRRHPQELYSARLEAVQWYETHYPDKFDLYGLGWNDIAIRGADRLRRWGLMPLLSRLMPPQARPSWRGAVPAKTPVLARYRFALTYENVRDVPGYITEKIFDAFLAGTVPIYWGAPDITASVPKDCFIDYRDYGDQARLFERLNTMTDEDYLAYLGRIEAFIRSQVDGPFGLPAFVNSVLKAVARHSERQAG